MQFKYVICYFQITVNEYIRQFAYVYDLNLCVKTWKKLQVHAQQRQIICWLTTYNIFNNNHEWHLTSYYHTSSTCQCNASRRRAGRPNPAFILTPQCAGTRPWQKIKVTPIWLHVRAGAKGTTLENASFRFEKQKQEVMQGVVSTSSNRSLVTRVSESRWLCQLSLTSFLAPSNSQEQYRELKINHCTTVT